MCVDIPLARRNTQKCKPSNLNHVSSEEITKQMYGTCTCRPPNVKALIKLVLLKESTVYSVYCINILHFGTVVSCDCILAGTFIRNF